MRRALFKTALVLSGGSARGLAHLGVIEKVQEHRIPVDLIVGTSMGAVIGGLYAYYGDAAAAVARIRAMVEDELFIRTVSAAAEEEFPQVASYGSLNRFIWLFRRGVYYTHSMIRPTLVPEETYAEIMEKLIPDQKIEKLRIPFAAVSMDLLTGEELVLRRGSLRKAVSASAAIPGILPPIELHGRTLVDGGWVDNVPVAAAIAMGADFVVASDTCLDIPSLGALPTSAIESLFRCNEISRIILTGHRKSHADLLLTPDIGPMYWANFSQLDRCLSAGRAALEENLKALRRKRALRRFLSLSGLIHPARRRGWRHPLVMV